MMMISIIVVVVVVVGGGGNGGGVYAWQCWCYWRSRSDTPIILDSASTSGTDILGTKSHLHYHNQFSLGP